VRPTFTPLYDLIYTCNQLKVAIERRPPVNLAMPCLFVEPPAEVVFRLSLHIRENFIPTGVDEYTVLGYTPSGVSSKSK